MTFLQDLADERNFGPVEGRDWQQVDRFSPPTEAIPLPVERPYDEIKPEVVAVAREEVEKAFVTTQHQLEEDKY